MNLVKTQKAVFISKNLSFKLNRDNLFDEEIKQEEIDIKDIIHNHHTHQHGSFGRNTMSNLKLKMKLALISNNYLSSTKTKDIDEIIRIQKMGFQYRKFRNMKDYLKRLDSKETLIRMDSNTKLTLSNIVK